MTPVRGCDAAYRWRYEVAIWAQSGQCEDVATHTGYIPEAQRTPNRCGTRELRFEGDGAVAGGAHAVQTVVALRRAERPARQPGVEGAA